MAVIDFTRTTIPDRMAEETPLVDLLDTIREADSLTLRMAEVIDFIYRVRLRRIIEGAHSKEKMLQARRLNDHLARVTHVRHQEKLSQLIEGIDYFQRWLAYQAILEDVLFVGREKS